MRFYGLINVICNLFVVVFIGFPSLLFPFVFFSGFAVGIYTTNSPEACQYVAANCSANIIIVENDMQLQKILKVRDQLPHLKALVQWSGTLTDTYPNTYTVIRFIFKKNLYK